MTTVELQARKAILIQEILNNLNTETAISNLEKYISKLSRKTEYPDLCSYTHEEKINRLNEAEEAFDNGYYTTHEKMESRVDKLKESWKH